MQDSRYVKILFILLIGIAIFYNLDERPFFGVEGRWAEGAREMSLRSSWFVPTINFEPHVTKPLIPFWLIKISGELLGYSEFSARLPGALLALLSVGIFYLLAKKLFEKEWAFWGTIFYGISLGFIQFARLSQSEIYQLFGVVSAIAIYVYYREKISFLGYFLFVLALLFGALSKGFTTIAVLTLFVFIDIIIYRRFYHFNLKLILSLLIGIFIYFFHYYLIAKELNTELPFYLWFRENVKQAVDPYDNLRPFYIYLYYWPLWVAPLSLFLLGALYQGLKNFKNLNLDQKVFLITNLAIFFLFTLAKARRDYYILPILPFSIVLITYYLKDSFRDKVKTLLMKIYIFLSYALPFLVLLSPLWLKKQGYPIGKETLIFIFVVFLFQIWGILVLSKRASFLHSIILVFFLVEVLFFAYLQPVYSVSTEKLAGIFVK
ncbi:MAG: glycosyltransferase family 39 protein, partial [Thermodesulfobacterium sp.]|nr:glycosyltransferase family 39 protein [Thermodesulfobacterium sp.]